MTLFKSILKFAREKSGATAIEYALIAGIICIAVVGGITTLGQSANSSYTNVSQQVWGS
ncbi:MAG TPA: Flp family type IVb pilin [Hyphomonadaceae bacterium]|nr:Flp family type IVb pilin [Hyphomonadaceae bacterium]